MVALASRRAIFVDSSAWFALLDADDSDHTTALRRFGRATDQRRPLVATNHVLGETYTLARRRLGNRAALAFLQQTRDDPLVQRVFVSEAWEEQAERLLAQYDDQPFSYVDATSFVTMRQLHIQEVLTFDRDFLIAGFRLVGDE
jgi:predicted nucleic acid-binding protein